jgi:hypothetical protein
MDRKADKESIVTRKVTPDTEKLDNVVIEGQKAEYTVAEIKHSNRIVKSATPKGDLSWWIKWASSIIVLCAITIRSANVPNELMLGMPLQVWDILLSWIGAAGWFIVGFMWKDRALILLNGVITIMLFGGLIRYFVQ